MVIATTPWHSKRSSSMMPNTCNWNVLSLSSGFAVYGNAKTGHRYFPSGHFPSDRKTTFPIRRPFPSAPFSIRTAFHPCHFPSVPLSIRATFHPFGSYIKKDGKFYRWKVARMGSGTDGKWYRWKVSSMENDVWKGSSDGKCRRMGNVPMGNSGDPFFSNVILKVTCCCMHSLTKIYSILERS